MILLPDWTREEGGDSLSPGSAIVGTVILTPPPVSSDDTAMTGRAEKAIPGEGDRSGGVNGIEGAPLLPVQSGSGRLITGRFGATCHPGSTIVGDADGPRGGDLGPTAVGDMSIPLIPSTNESSLPSSLTTDGCFLRVPSPADVVGMPRSRLLELLTPTGGFGSGLFPGELKPIRSSDLMDERVSDRSMVACTGE